jgi:porin
MNKASLSMKLSSVSRYPRRSVRWTLALLLAVAPLVRADLVDLQNPFNLLNQAPLAGDFFGYRSKAETNGVVLSAQSVSDMLGNVAGGTGAGGAYAGVLNLGLAADLGKAAGWEGASFKSTWLWLYGNDLSSRFIGNAMTASGIYGEPTFRCYELWLQQNALHDALSLRAGLLGLDTEFGTSDVAAFFVNSTFGIPAGITMNLPNGGPTYPMATPGVRLAVQPASWLTLRSAIAQGNSFQQEENRYGFNWNFGPSTGLLSLNQADVTWCGGESAKGLPGTAKAGFWIQTGSGVPSQIEFGSPTVASYSSGFYGMIDQQIYRAPADKAITPPSSGKNPVGSGQETLPEDTVTKGLSAFARAVFSPQSWSPCSFYSDGGLVYTGLIPGRDKDKLGAAFAYAGMGSLCCSQTAESGCPGCGYECVAELTYSIRLTPSISLQPDLQYILHPRGSRQYGNALVVGFQAVVDF